MNQPLDQPTHSLNWGQRRCDGMTGSCMASTGFQGILAALPPPSFSFLSLRWAGFT